MSAAPGEPSLKDVLRRVGAYVDVYGEKTSIVVATERYTQEVRSSSGSPATHRVLLSDFAIVRVEGIRGWMGFRDVVEVDGTKIENREERLVQSLISSSGSYDEARRITTESARYNIGSVLRTFNVPTTALFFFKSDGLDRFKFTSRKNDAGEPWEIAFRETEKPTLIRTPDGRALPTEGSIWVDPANGTIVRTRIKVSDVRTRAAGSNHASADVEVTYQRVAALDMWLPSAMTESYEGTEDTSRERITGHAEYSDYRQFQTTVRIK
jgi:hypothetical protein